jgi:DNA repair exonuclease SbcCD ATPase subunit
MKQQEFKKEITQKLDDVNEKIQELKKISNRETGNNEKLEEILQQMESIKENILEQYDTIEKLKKSDNKDISDIQKKLSKSFDSFEIAYSNSSSLMKQRKFSTRSRSVDFNNPSGNR